MTKIASIALTAVSAICLAIALPAGDALAQQKQKISYKVTAGDSKYLQRHTVEADDEPGHLMSIYEIHRKFPADGPAINGVRIKESFTRGYGDYMSSNGLSTNYTTFVLENGDKFFTKGLTLGQADAAGKRSTISVNNITGATGKLAGMKGILRGRGASDGKAGYNETTAELEYWFEK
jgi:hypothetical protein